MRLVEIIDRVSQYRHWCYPYTKEISDRFQISIEMKNVPVITVCPPMMIQILKHITLKDSVQIDFQKTRIDSCEMTFVCQHSCKERGT